MDDNYRAAVDAAAIFSETDLRGNITYVNQQFCSISGYSREELLGANHRILNSGLHEPTFLSACGGLWSPGGCGRAKSATGPRTVRCTGSTAPWCHWSIR